MAWILIPCDVEHRKKKRALKILLIVLIVCTGAAAVLPVLISQRYEAAIRERIPLWVAGATDSLYRVSVQDIEISFFTKNIILTGVSLQPDSARLYEMEQLHALPSMVLSLNLSRLELNGIRWAKLIARKELSCNRILLSAPAVTMDKNPDSLTTKQPGERKDEGLTGAAEAQEIVVTDPEFIYRDHKRPDSLSLHLSKGKIMLKDWRFDRKDGDAERSFFYAAGGEVTLDSMVIKKHNSFYAFRTGKVGFSSGGNSFTVRNFHISPAGSREEFERNSGHQDEMITADLPLIRCAGFDWSSFLKTGKLEMDTLQLERPSVEVFIDRKLPKAPPKIRRFPMQQLQELQLPVAIRNISVRNGAIIYTELDDETLIEGSLPFRNVFLSMQNLTNIAGKLKENALCTAEVQASVFDSPVRLLLSFDQRDTSGAFKVRGFQGPMDGTRPNTVTAPLAKMEMKTLKVDSLRFYLDCNGSTTHANFCFLYHDLKLNILKAGEDGQLGGRAFLSFIINAALFYPHNPMPGEAVRTHSFDIPRSHYKSIFNVLWTTLRTGMLLTAGRNPGVADIITNRKKAKESKEAKKNSELTTQN